MNSLTLSKELANNPTAMQNLADMFDKDFEIMDCKYTPKRKKNKLQDIFIKYSFPKPKDV